MSAIPLVQQLTDLRRAAGVTQRDLASAMGTTQSTISELEAGAHPDPRWSTLLRYAAAVGAELDVMVRATSATPASAGAPEAPPKTDLHQGGDR